MTSIVPTNLPTGYKGAINIQTLTETGLCEKQYYYHQGETGRGAKADGWWDDDTTRITAENDVVFAPGTGLWVVGLDGTGVQTSGQVVTEDVTVMLREGATMVANPYPVAIKLTSLKPVGLPTGYKGAINIQTLTETGLCEKQYYYHEGETGRGAKADGWWDDDTTRITAENDVEFAGGAGLWIVGLDGTSITFSFPTAE